MGEKLSFAPRRTALLSMDLQTGVVSVYVKDDDFIPRIARVLDLARHAGMRVVHVKVGFRRNVPEASPRNVFLTAGEFQDALATSA
jgi:nicotinamidase-related amidase